MEDTLRVRLSFLFFILGFVLILVLMEDTLREFFFKKALKDNKS